MALQRARVTPTKQEKRYNTLQFLEASVMHGNKVKIRQVDKYEITSLSSEHFTYKSPIETYITFNERPSVKLLRQYGWFREDQEIQPIIAYIPTHLLYDKEILNTNREYTNTGQAEIFKKENETLLKVSDNLKYTAYLKNDLIKLYTKVGDTYEHLYDIDNIQNRIKDIFFDETNETILVTKQSPQKSNNELISLINNQIKYNLNDLKDKLIINVIYNKDYVYIKTADSQAIYKVNGKNYKLDSVVPSNIEVKDFKKEYIISEHSVIYSYKDKTYTRLVLDRDQTNLTTTTTENNMITAYITDNEELRLFKQNEDNSNNLNFLYSIHLGETINPRIYMSNNLIIVVDEAELNTTKVNIMYYNLDKFRPQTQLYIQNINVEDIKIVGSSIYIFDKTNSLQFKIEPTGEGNYSDAVVNYTLLKGEDFKPLVDIGESEKYILDELKIRRGTIIDIYYDYIERDESLFYVTDVKVDTVSINYVVNLMPYKYDKEPEGEADSNTPLFSVDTRNQKL